MKIDADEAKFVVLQTIDTSFKAMTLRGDILAASDDVNETHIINWRTGDCAVLWGSDEPSEYNFQVRYIRDDDTTCSDRHAA